MKYLSDYSEQKQTALFDSLGAFFAFSNKQFEEKQKEGVKYISMGCGMITPEKNVKQLIDGLSNINKECIELDIAENGIDGIIRRELFNHECFYTGDIDSCIDKLQDYPISPEAIQAAYRHIRTTEEIDL